MKSKKVKALTFLCAFALSISTMGSIVYAYKTFGGSWPSKNVHYAIYSDVPSSYKSSINGAAAMWNDNTHISLTRDNSSNINVMAYNYGKQTFDGVSYMNGNTSFRGEYKYGNIQLNTYYTKDYSDLHIKLVVTHEFGHELGLAHNPNNNKCIMYGDDTNGGHVWEAYNNDSSLENAPAKDDIAGINSIY